LLASSLTYRYTSIQQEDDEHDSHSAPLSLCKKKMDGWMDGWMNEEEFGKKIIRIKKQLVSFVRKKNGEDRSYPLTLT
jgi:hypothetical protein